MRSPATNYIRMLSLKILFIMVTLPYANPIQPMPIIKVSYLDSLHWAIDFSLKDLPIYYNSKIPALTDTITFGASKNGSSAMTLQKCAIPVQLNPDSGTGSITSLNYPGLLLKAGMTIYMGIKNEVYKFNGPTLPQNLQPNTTLELKTITSTCYDYTPEGKLITSYTCTQKEYVSSNCLSYKAGRGQIRAVLTDRLKKPLQSISVACFTDLRKTPIATTQTSPNGSILLNNLDTCPSYVLRFFYNGNQYDYTISSVHDAQVKTPDHSIQIPYPPTSVVYESPTVSQMGTEAVRLLASTGDRGNLFVLSVYDNSLLGNGICEIYSLSGEIILSLPFACHGAGTYSIRWKSEDGKNCQITAGPYFCRIKIGKVFVCKNFIIR